MSDSAHEHVGFWRGQTPKEREVAAALNEEFPEYGTELLKVLLTPHQAAQYQEWLLTQKLYLVRVPGGWIVSPIPDPADEP